MTDVEKIKGVELSVGDDHKTISASVHLKDLDKTLTNQIITSLITDFAPEAKLFKKDIKELVKEIKNSRKRKETSIICRDVAVLLEAQITVIIAKDEMSASIKIEAPYGGEPATLAFVTEKLKEAGVVYGIDNAKIEQLTDKAKKLKSGEYVECIAARGMESKDGRNTSLNILFNEGATKTNSPQSIGDGKVDMRDYGDIPYVTSNEVLLYYIPNTKGASGITVKGREIKAIDGENVEKTVKAGDGVNKIEDKCLFIATRNGMPKFENGILTVEENYTRKICNIETGNIFFEGDVLITGSVEEGMEIKSGGDITIMGIVEHSNISAKGNVKIVGKLFGKASDGYKNSTANVFAGKDVQIGSVHGAIICANGNLTVDKEIIYSKISISGALTVGSGDSPSGGIFSSEIAVGSSVSAGKIGSDSHSRVFIDFTSAVDDVLQRARAVASLVQKQTNVLDKSLKLLHKASNKKSNLAPEKIRAVSAMCKQQKSKLDFLINEEEKAKDKAKETLDNIKVIVTKEIKPGVIIKYRESLWRSESVENRVKILMADNKFIEVPFT